MERNLTANASSDRLTRVYSRIENNPGTSLHINTRKSKTHGMISVRLARTKQELQEAYRIVYEQYMGAGYVKNNTKEMRFLPHFALPTSYTFIASDSNEKIIGTLTLVFDGQLGFPSEDEFPGPIKALRENGEKLAEISCLATEKQCERMAVVVSLYRAVYAYACHLKGATGFFISSMKKHMKFYTRHLLFDVIGDPVIYHDTNEVSVYPMILDFRNITNRFKEKHKGDIFARMFLEGKDFTETAEQIGDYTEEDLIVRYRFSKKALDWNTVKGEVQNVIQEAFRKAVSWSYAKNNQEQEVMYVYC
ncbi:hypothetical protein ACFL6F_02815 [Planctomycetota bacterium]